MKMTEDKILSKKKEVVDILDMMMKIGEGERDMTTMIANFIMTGGGKGITCPKKDLIPLNLAEKIIIMREDRIGTAVYPEVKLSIMKLEEDKINLTMLTEGIGIEMGHHTK